MHRLRNISIDPELISAPCSDGAKWTYVALCCAPMPQTNDLDTVVVDVAKMRRLPTDHILSHIIELIEADLIMRAGNLIMLPDMPNASEFRTIAIA